MKVLIVLIKLKISREAFPTELLSGPSKSSNQINSSELKRFAFRSDVNQDDLAAVLKDEEKIKVVHN